MGQQPDAPSGAVRLADRMAAARRARFVGRERELALYRAALEGAASYALLYLYGPGGVGKSTLLRAYTRVAEEHGRAAVLLDGRHLDPSPAGFIEALRRAMGFGGNGAGLARLAEWGPGVLLIDAFESLGSLDRWLRERLLPQLPGESLVVVAGRQPPGPGWRGDPGLAALTRAVALENLTTEEARRYLLVRGVPENQHARLLAFTRGHPLALSLVGDLLEGESDEVPFSPDRRPDVIRMLLERFVDQIPGPLHRRALELCALARFTTEPLLAAVVDEREATTLFEWLRTLSFVESGPQGLVPHDLARELLIADRRWRNPEAFERLYHDVQRQTVARLQQSDDSGRQRASQDFLFLVRHNPVAARYFDWEAFGHYYSAPPLPEDIPIILELVRRHEGEASERVVAYWLERQPRSFTVYRSADEEVAGFLANLTLDAPHESDMTVDPAVASAWAIVERRAPLRPGERISYKRFWMGRDQYQSRSAIFNLIAITSVAEWVGDPRLAWSFAAYQDAEFWAPNYRVLEFERTVEADFVVGGQRYGVFARDWRREPIARWLGRLVEIGLSDRDAPPPRADDATLLVLDESDFASAVRDALRDYASPDRLARNPLLRARLLAAEGDPSPERLRALLREATERLATSPRDEKFYRALHRTYLDPAPTQEAAAERLGLPFSTYRYRLARGIERVTAWLWRRELGYPEA